MYPSPFEYVATVIFLLAVLHTFLVKRFEHMAKRYPNGSIGENIFHLLGEVEVVFGLWSLVLMMAMIIHDGQHATLTYLEGRNFTEPLFVFAIMTIAATRPILAFFESAMQRVAHALSRITSLSSATALYLSILILGPLLGSLITEPAAITITALMLKRTFYDTPTSMRFKVWSFALLLVNISIGGTLTPYAAPPVLMVAQKWGWDLSFMLSHFGLKALLAITLNTVVCAFIFRKTLAGFNTVSSPSVSLPAPRMPFAMSVIHLLFLIGVVLSAHHSTVFIGVLLFFIGFTHVTREYQDELRIREALLVAFFLAGLVVLGGLQGWWISPLLATLSSGTLFIGAAALTAITDNAAITYLGSLAPHLSDLSKYALVSGSVIGGGLTLIANAPNPAGYGILKSTFGEEGISPLALFVAAVPPTLIAALCFWFL